MKKIFVVLVLIISMVFAACSTPGTSFSYPQPVLASDTAVFIGTGRKYALARDGAIKEGLAKGYTKILAETIEIEGTWGMTQVTLVMLK